MEPQEGVVGSMEGPDDSEVTFALHSASVFCVSLDPKTNTLAVTGVKMTKLSCGGSAMGSCSLSVQAIKTLLLVLASATTLP